LLVVKFHFFSFLPYCLVYAHVVDEERCWKVTAHSYGEERRRRRRGIKKERRKKLRRGRREEGKKKEERGKRWREEKVEKKRRELKMAGEGGGENEEDNV
jgi:hypothetical protein